MGELPADLERIFREIHEQEGGVRPVTLTKAYLKVLREVEELPCNQAGQDKSWVVRVERRWRETIRNSRRLT
jgi:hypothetical protein